ncbi:MAG: helix-turn-helix transcriptional regulator [Oscillospiraceae bacterium]|nr:helix-turn-helix transcriptional regulator [Oscillospiraceae bacterium]MBQ4544535.1 helix-turn-helix transcriptional regulator [Oscillospiraceae bacterium]MBQ6902100.1 helix-turn-helix transcriptional regulator [Oscillospiraceae bacterium]
MSVKFERIIDDLIMRRKKLGITQLELAEMAELAQPAISRLESKRTVPQLDTLIKVADALGCELKVMPNGTK